jgi:hypothetical protein
MLEDNKIIWVEDPTKYEYLRKSPMNCPSRRFPVKSMSKRIGHLYKVIGYELQCKVEQGSYLFNMYWLKTYDRGTPEGLRDVYATGGYPAEAIMVKKLMESKPL